MIKLLQLVFIVLCSSSTLLLPKIGLAQSNYTLVNYNQDHGLTSSTISGIYKDHHGFLWLSSERGLNRFDGYQFKSYYEKSKGGSFQNLSSILSFCMTRNGTVLLKTTSTLCKLNPDKGNYTPLMEWNVRNETPNLYQYSNYFMLSRRPESTVYDSMGNYWQTIKMPKEGLINSPILEDTGLWLITKNGAYFYTLASKQFIFNTYIDANKQLVELNKVSLAFFKNKNGALCFIKDKQCFSYVAEKHAFIQLPDFNLTATTEQINSWNFIFSLNQDTLLVTDRVNAIYAIDLKTGLTKQVLAIGSATNPVYINSIFHGAKNGFWISTFNNGIFHVNAHFEILEKYADEVEKTQHPYFENVEFILEDENVVWVCSPGNGLIKIEPARNLVQRFEPPSLVNTKYRQNENIRVFCELNKEQVLIGTLGGLFLHDFKTGISGSTNYSLNGKHEFDQLPISCIIKDRYQNIWISTWNGNELYVIDPKTKIARIAFSAKLYPVELSSIRTIFCDSKDRFWIGTASNKIIRLNLDSLLQGKIPLNKAQLTCYSGDKKNNVIPTYGLTFKITETPDHQIFCATEGGLLQFNESTNSFKYYSARTTTKPNSLNVNDIRAVVAEGSKGVWVGTNGGGLNYFDRQTESFTHYTTENGLPDNSIYSIVADQQGYLWLGTNRGICRFAINNKSVFNLSIKDGIQNYEYNTNAGLLCSNGLICLGGIKGVNFFKPNELKQVNIVNPVLITGLTINGHSRTVPIESLHLAYDENYLVFQFAGLGFYRNEEYQYAYQLVGLDKDWINCGTQRQVNYANLPPGRYTFRLKGCDCFGNWTESEQTLTIIIKTPWFKTWWFYLLLLVLVVSFSYAFIRFRLNQLVKMQTVRNNIARDLHDEVGSNLSNISLFNAVAIEKAAKVDTTLRPLLAKIAEYTQQSQEAMSDIVWMISSKNDQFDNIVIKMRSYAENILEDTPIQVHFNFANDLSGITLDMLLRKNLYLIYKEALNNMLKYAHCKNCWISMTKQHNKLVLTIIDDGVGFELAKVKSGNGLLNFEKRAKELKGTLELKTAPNEGTKLEVIIPIP